jgi:hypothetical protein
MANMKPGVKYAAGQEVDDGQNIEAVIAHQKDLARIVKEEAFLNEPVTIHIESTGNENEPPSFVLNVNGLSQPIFRDVDITMRRCFVEVLARCKETKFIPQEADMRNPLATNIPRGKTGFTYPFRVIEDKNPIGREWLNAVRAEPA